MTKEQLLELAEEIYQQSFEANNFYEIMMQLALKNFLIDVWSIKIFN